MDGAAEPVTAAVVGRYAGVVDVLAQILTSGGVTVTLTWGADSDPAVTLPPPVTQDRNAIVVVTVGPGDRTLAALRSGGLTGSVVAVVWHPDDEIGAIPGPHRVVRAGQIRATLVDVVVGMGKG